MTDPSTLDAYLEQDGTGVIVRWSADAEAVFGWTTTEAIGMPTRLLVPERNRQRNDDAVRAFVASGDGGVRRRQITVVHKDGREFNAEFSTRLVVRDGIAYVASNARPIAMPQPGAEAFAPNDIRYRNILDQIQDGCTVVDLRGTYLFVNDAFCRMFGYRKETLLGKSFRATTSQTVTDSLFRVYSEVYKAGLPATFEYHVERTGRFYEQSVSLEKDAAGRPIGFLAITRDCTDRRLADQDRARAKEEAEAANQAKGEFLANVSHEIRTPMNGIIGMTELALDTELTPYQRDCLATVKSSAESLLTILNDILDFSKIESRNLELEAVPFSLPDLVADTVKPLAVRADQKGLELITDIGADVPTEVIGDPVRLKQVITNLVGNAIKFTERGFVLVRVRPEKAVAGSVRLRFLVTDTGIGIASEKQQAIFQPFRQADGSTTRRFGGTGLGLAISSTLVQMMGGTLSVESEPGHGSTFQFSAGFDLPAETARRAAPVDFDGVRVLIVDDNEVNRRVFENVTRHWRMEPTMVASGEAAIAAMTAASRQARPFSLVLLDSNMPEMDGFQVAAAIGARQELIGATIMMLTSSGEYGDVSRCRDLGIAAYLTKPVKQADLYDAVSRVLGGASAARAGAGRASRTGLAARPVNVLLAEDNVVNQRVAVGLLTRRGHRVTVAGNGLEVLEAMERDSYDVVLMDVQMPEMGGLEATQAIRVREEATGRRVRIVAMTAHAMAGDRERCLAAGMDGYLAKPVEPAALFAAVEQRDVETTRTAAPALSPVVDRASLIERLGGDEALLREVIKLFQGDCPVRLAALKAAVDGRDADRIRTEAHALKGAAANLSAAGLAEAAATLERIGAENRLAAAEAAWRRLSGEATAVLDVLRRFERARTVVG